MAKANSSTKCYNYNKCKYTGTCGEYSSSYKWLTPADSDVTVAGCYKGVNYATRYPSATTESACNSKDSSSSGGSSAFLWFLCCLICVVGIPIFICWWCNSCCCKGRGRRVARAPPAPAAAPAPAAPVIVQIYNNKDND